MKTVKHITVIVVWTLLGLYLLLVMAVNIPAIQSLLGETVAKMVSDKIASKVEIAHVDIGLFNRVIMDGVTIYDQRGKVLLKSSRLSAKVDLQDLIDGKISISSAQIFSTDIKLYQQNADSKPNFQFILDSLASKDTTSKSPLNLKINSLIIRHSNVAFDRMDAARTPGRLNPHHLNISNISAHINLKVLTEDSVSANIRKLSLSEHSGIDIKRLSMKVEAGRNSFLLSDFMLKMPNTEISSDNVSAYYRFKNGKLVNSSLKCKGAVNAKRLTLSDIASLVPAMKDFDSALTADVVFDATYPTIGIKKLYIDSEDGELIIDANGTINNLDSTPTWTADINSIGMSAKTVAFLNENIKGQETDVPEILSRIGSISVNGTIESPEKGTYMADIDIKTDAGSMSLNVDIDNNNYSGRLRTDGLKLNTILGNNDFGNLVTDIKLQGLRSGNSFSNIAATGKVDLLEYKKYPYHDITIDGNYGHNIIEGLLKVDDPNVTVEANGKIETNDKNKIVNLTAYLHQIRPKSIMLSDRWGDAVMTGNITADFSGKDINDASGQITLSDVAVKSETTDYELSSMTLSSGYEGEDHFLHMESDFGNAKITGQFNYSTLAQTFINIIAKKLPTLPGLPQTTNSTNNVFKINAFISKTDWLRQLLGTDITLSQPLSLHGDIDGKMQTINIDCSLPEFLLGEDKYINAHANITSPNDSLACSVAITKRMNGGAMMAINLEGNAANNNLNSALSWKNITNNKSYGTINTFSSFFLDDANKPAADIKVKHSNIVMNGAKWDINPSSIYFSDKRLIVDNFSAVHNNQHIFINGTATESDQDSIIIDLRGIDVEYVLDLVNFHSVDFSGSATGKAYLASLFGNPRAYGKLIIDKFKFENGRMGVLDADVSWNNMEKQIDIEAVADNGPRAMTFINGYVSPSKNYIDLGIDARGTSIEFVNSFTSSFMRNVSGNANGLVHLVGPLNAINLVGNLVVNGQCTVNSLNTTYYLKSDTVNFIPNEIELRHAPLYDIHDNVGYVTGNIHHKNLSKLSYDLDITTDKMLVYDFTDFGESNFYATIYGKGDVGIHGKSGQLNINTDITPLPGSVFVYDVFDQDNISDQKFIEWNDKTNLQPNDSTSASGMAENNKPVSNFDFGTDINIDFKINCTPDATIKLLMDSRSNDYITLNGTGIIRANFFNKGTFTMFGTYEVANGTYGITIQDIIKKNFIFNEGGTITFQGNPFEAPLNLQASYTVNGVSLSDLNVGNSFSNNTIRVNCLMNITGTPEKPQIDFDFDLPTVGTDEKQMIRSLINSEEEMNQQVIYLLGIGRFYPQSNNNETTQSERQSQTTLAMQSLLSGTLSSQINSLLGSMINSNNWNFGANISTGNEGWNNAEYEGLLSGRLLNNRLLINGQFGYRDNAATDNQTFIGDFDVRYLLLPNGNIAVKVYNQTNDRYFTKSSLNTQGVGIIMKKDFDGISDFFSIRKKKKVNK